MDSVSLITEQHQTFGSIHIYFKFYVDFGLISQLIITKRIVDFFRQTSGRKDTAYSFLEKSRLSQNPAVQSCSTKCHYIHVQYPHGTWPGTTLRGIYRSQHKRWGDMWYFTYQRLLINNIKMIWIFEIIKNSCFKKVVSFTYANNLIVFSIKLTLV